MMDHSKHVCMYVCRGLYGGHKESSGVLAHGRLQVR